MDVLPTKIAVLDENFRALKPRRWWEKVDPKAEGRVLSEAQWDEIICAHKDVVEDALRQAEVIDWDSKLMLLGTQIDCIDVLFAEVKQSTEEIRGLVLLEDKLLRNPQARREVLAQILDYAQRVQDDWLRNGVENMIPAHANWINENRDELIATIARGELLLGA